MPDIARPSPDQVWPDQVWPDRFRDDGAPSPHRLSDRLRAHGINPTVQRVSIAAILLARPQHLSAEQVFRLANRGGLAVSKATVYNTLGLFARHRVIREVIVDRAKVFYDSNPIEHFHFYDVDTGTLIDIGKDEIDIERLPELPSGAVVERVDVIVRIRTDPA